MDSINDLDAKNADKDSLESNPRYDAMKLGQGIKHSLFIFL